MPAPIPAIVFGETALLWGAAAAAGPVVLHFLMKSRARPVVFPAMRFVMAGKAGTSGRLKLRHLLLLLLRMLVIVLLAGALAWPSCNAESTVEPVAVVLAFDNSASMGYRVEGVTRLELARKRAARVLRSLPPGSEAAVVDLARLGTAPVWQTVPMGEEALSAVKPVPSAAPLAPLVRSALAAVSGRRPLRKAVYLFTDMTTGAWPDKAESPPSAAAGVQILVVDCSITAEGGPAEDRNFAMLRPRPVRDPVREEQPARVEVTVRAAAVRKAVRVAVRWDGEPPAVRESFGPFAPLPEPASATKDSAGTAPSTGSAPGATSAGPVPDLRTEEFVQTGLKVGVRTARAVLETEDPLPADDAAFFHLSVRKPVKIVFAYGPVAGTAEGAPHRLLAEMIEPSSRPRKERQADVLRRPVTAGPGGTGYLDDLEGADLLVMLDVPPQTPAAWDRIDRFVRSGGRLWIVLGSTATTESLVPAGARGLMPVTVGELRIARPPARITPAHPAAPTLRFFAGPASGDLARIEISRHRVVTPTDRDTEVWGLLTSRAGRGTAPGAAVGAAESVPAVLHRRVERGRVLLWTWGAGRSWSNMQDFVEEWPVLVQETLAELLSRGPGRRDSYLYGEPVRWQLSDNLAGKEVRWGRAGGGEEPTRRFLVGPGGVADFGTPEEPGNYLVRLPTPTGAFEEEAFSVNIDPAETLMHPQSREWIRSRFPPELAERLRFPGEGDLDTGGIPAEEPVAGHLALVMLLFLVMESWFGNRFYKEESPVAAAR